MILQADSRIKQLRQARGISQSELARIMSVTRSSVNAWEMGISIPTAAKLVELSLFFHVSADYLLGLDNSESIQLDSFTQPQKELIYALLSYFQKEDEENASL